MKQLNIAKFVLLAGTGIGLMLLIFTGHRLGNTNFDIVHHKQKVETPQKKNAQSEEYSEREMSDKATQILEVATSPVDIKSPQRTNHHDDSPSTDNVKERSPFYVAKKNNIAQGIQTQKISLSQTNELWDRVLISNGEEEEWKGLPEQLTPRVQPVSPLRYSGKPSETEFQLDAIGQQLGTLADNSQLQYQHSIRKSATQVRNLQREMRINKLQHHLQQLKWSQSSRNNRSRRLENRYAGQRYFFIARKNNPSIIPQEPPSPEFLSPSQPAAEAKTARQWSPRKIKLR